MSGSEMIVTDEQRQAVEEVLEELTQAELTLLRAEVERLRAERDRYEELTADGYQVVGAIAAIFGVMEHPEVQRALDHLSEIETDKDGLLPWPRNALQQETEANG